QMEVPAGGGVDFSVSHDGEHRALSQFQIAGIAIDQHLYQSDYRRALRGVAARAWGIDFVLRSARVFCAVLGLWFHSAAHLRPDAPGDRRRRGGRGWAAWGSLGRLIPVGMRSR